MKRFYALFLMAALLAASVFSGETSTGAITAGTQYIDGQKIFLKQGLNDVTLTANATLDLGSKRFQRCNPSGAHRDVTLPAVAISEGLWYYFINSGSGNNLVVKDATGATICTVAQNQCAFVCCSGTAWKGAAFGAAFSGGLAADGSVAGATGQAQDFGTNGIKADVIAESTGAAGVTIDGLLIKDNAIATLNNTTLNTVNVDCGASGTAGSVDIFPTTAANGKLSIVATDVGVNNTVTITNAAQTGARTYTIPDAGASSSFVMLAGTQTLTGTKTINTLNSTTFTCTNADCGASGTAGSLDVFPATGSKGKLTIVAADSAGDTTTTITNASQAGARTYTVPDAGASASFVMTEGAQTVNGVKTMGSANVITHSNTAGMRILDTGGDHYIALTTGSDEAANRTLTIPALGGNDTLMTLAVPGTVSGTITFSGTAGKVVRASQRYQYSIAGGKVGGTAGFTLGAANNIFNATVAASQTGAKFILPIPTLKTGSVITAFGLLGQIESAGNGVTVDADLRGSVTAAADFTDSSLATMTQISVTADTAVDSTQDKTGLSITVAQTTQYYIVITVTTNAATDFDLRGVSLVVTEQ